MWCSTSKTLKPDNECSQKSWDLPLIDLSSKHLLDSAKNSPFEEARLKAVSTKESGAWLNALPVAFLGTLLDDESFRISVGLRLGCSICTTHKCRCGSTVNEKGVHGLSCKFSAGRFPRHSTVNDLIRRALTTSDIPAILEPLGISRDDGKRPDGMSLIPWSHGKPSVWDFTCVDTVAASHIDSTSKIAGGAADSAEKMKLKKYSTSRDQYILYPVAIETYGSFGPYATELFNLIERELIHKTDDNRARSFLIQQKLWSNDPSIRVVCLDDLKLRIQRFAPQFRGSSQQDAQEFLCYLLEGLHEDVNMAVDEPNPNPKPVLMEIDKSFSFNVDAMDSWSRFLIMNKSKFVDNFVGQLKSTLRCTFCGYCSETFDPFWELSLPIPQRSGQLSLSHCLDSFTSVEILDGEEKPTCSMCREKRKCLKFPKILVIHLKRFSQSVEFSEKLNTFVDFPLIGLDMSPYAAEDIVPCPNNLYAISNHSGTTYSGHFTAYCRHLYTKIWHEYNDSLVSSIPPNSLVSGDAYILFYQQEAHPKFEQRDVDSVKSYCSVADPDSTLRTVYSADNHDMFNTVVEKHETPVYLAPAAHSDPVDIVHSGPVLNFLSNTHYGYLHQQCCHSSGNRPHSSFPEKSMGYNLEGI
ncbi:unnamed protein product [Phaedon cochleariae]|uniref:ubiquitinyl hydrolase 1 n=1 Tax=Phaedon cochleariae TaxID=80249 RepID=A0A9P0DGY2_PHACE|nr:unnamed protein product [Phaedon cochleariae]